MNRPRALVVDDEPDIRELIEITLERMEITTTSVANLADAYSAAKTTPFHLCLTDMRLPDGNGIDLIRHMHQNHPGVPVAMITAHGNMSSAIEALKAGAFDFVSKPVDLQVLRNLVGTALKLGDRAATSNRSLIGNAASMENVRATIAKLARSQAPVYVSGESGTGKELVARMIHEQGPRSESPFVPVNCGAIPDELMESELFGHKKGSFTGAVADKLGLFQAADGGTLFLDEVADLPFAMQVKMLRAIQEKCVRPVGVEQEVAVDVRILSASHKDLDSLVKLGHFRRGPGRDRALDPGPGRRRGAGALRFSRQRARAREYPRTRHDALRGRGHRGGGSGNPDRGSCRGGGRLRAG
jgi:two-component system response regulator PilR (NtrC family)